MPDTANRASDVAQDPAIGWLEQKSRGFATDADDLRAGTDRAAKGLSALATAGLTAVGIAKVGAVYPWPSGGISTWIWVLVLVLGFLGMVASVVWFVIRFWQANR